MLKLFCTRKLAELLPEKLEKSQTIDDPLDCWYANVITVQRRKIVVVSCADNRFGFVLWGVKKEHLQNFPATVRNCLRETLQYYHVNPEIIERYAASDAPMEIYAASDRKGTAQNNKVVECIQNLRFSEYPEEFLPLDVVHAMNLYFLSSKSDPFTCPFDKMMAHLQERYHETPIVQPVYLVEATMDLERFITKRTIAVSTSGSFGELHRVLQIAFGWGNCHLHDFVLQDNGGELHILPSEEEGKEMGVPYALEIDAKLSGYLNEGSDFLYLYDFGDSWEVNVHIAAKIDDYDKPVPVCIECEGAAPPDDVGGVDGFLNFLDAMADPNHPEHEELKEWIGYRWDEKPNQRLINSRLKYHLMERI